MYRLCIPLLAGLALAWLSIVAARAGEATPEVRPAEFEAAPARQFSPQPLQPETGLHILEENEQGITLELLTPDYAVETSEAEGHPCQVVRVDGYAETAQVGWPRLPLRGAMLGIPPEAELKLTVLEAVPKTAPGSYDLCPVARPQAGIDLESGAPTFEGYIAERDLRAYSLEIFTPTQAAEIVETAYIRSQRVAQLRFNPFQYNPSSGELRYYPRLRVRLEFGDLARRPAAGVSSVDEGAFETLLQTNLVNYATARNWREEPATARINKTSTSSDYPYLTQPAYKILVDKNGIYEINYQDLVEAGLDLTDIDPHTFQIYNRGREIAIYISGESDGRFDAEDAIIFYAQEAGTKYARTNVYWLVWGNAPGKRMTEVNGQPREEFPFKQRYIKILHLEKDTYYLSSRPSGPNQDHWFWDLPILVNSNGATASRDFSFSIQNILTDPTTATIRGLLKGYEAVPYQHTQVILNGHVVDDSVWDAMDDHQFEVHIPQDFLFAGQNLITVRTIADGNVTRQVVFINWFEIEFAGRFIAEDDFILFTEDETGSWNYSISGFTTSTLEVFDVTDAWNVKYISSSLIEPESGAYRINFSNPNNQYNQFWVAKPTAREKPKSIYRDSPSDWKDVQYTADYLIITHQNFYTHLIPLKEYRESQGLQTLIVKVEDIYDEFNYGIVEPEAIREFIGYAYHEWQPPTPIYVLLAGDGHFDFRDNYGYGVTNYVPPYLADVDPWMREVGSDNKYASVHGNDYLPDVLLGRVNIRNISEAQRFVNKVITYENNPPAGDWNERVLFVADNKDSAGDFALYSDQVADYYLPAEYSKSKAYYLVTHPTIQGVRNAILNAFNQGSLMISYVGHGSYSYWATEKFLQKTNIPTLQNGHPLPFLTPMTCLDGYFVFPEYPAKDDSSLGESMVRAIDKGAIGSFSPSGLGVASGHDYLEKGLFTAVFNNYQTLLGAATTAAKLYLYSQTSVHHDLIDTYLLFGDPAVDLQVLRPDVGIRLASHPSGDLEIGQAITYTITYSNQGDRPATSVVISNVISDGLENITWTSSGSLLSQRPNSSHIWDVENLSPGQGGIITITANVKTDFAGLIDHQVEIACLGDIHKTDNWDQIIQSVNLPRLKIRKTIVKQVPVWAGDMITYTLLYSNAGTAEAFHIIVSDSLAEHLLNPTWIHTGSAVVERPGNPFTWDIQNLLPGQGGVITITAQINPWFSGKLVNTAYITGQGEYVVVQDQSSVSITVFNRVYLPIIRTSNK